MHSIGPRQGLRQVEIASTDDDTNWPSDSELLEGLAPDGRECSRTTRFDDELQSFPHKSHRSANLLGAAKAGKTISKADDNSEETERILRAHAKEWLMMDIETPSVHDGDVQKLLDHVETSYVEA